LSSEASSKTWFHGTGRRKESVARVFVRPGSGKFTVNGRPVEQYFPNFAWKHDATEPVKFTNLADQIDIVVTAQGGGVGGQAGAVRMGLSRAISRFNPELRPSLRKNGFLTRDSRMKERKEVGQKARESASSSPNVNRLAGVSFCSDLGRINELQRRFARVSAEITAGKDAAKGCS